MKRTLALLVVLAAGCPKGGEKPKPEPAGRGDAREGRLLPELDDGGVATLPPAPPVPAVPASLPPPPAHTAISPEAVALGEALFSDPRVSADGSRSCATCHDPATGYAGGVMPAADGKQNLRRTPTLVNLAWVKAFGWDGRYPTLAEHLPVHVKGQLGEALDALALRLDAIPVYHAHFARLGGATPDAVLRGLSAFALTRYEGDAPWDRMERTALSTPGAAAKDPIVAGYQLFMGKAQCGACHPPPLYTDGGYHRVEHNTFNDPARGRVDPALQGAFRTPTLRGARTRTAFFHAGTKKSLAEVIAHYQATAATAGGNPNEYDPLLAKIKVSPDEAKQLEAFVEALSPSRRP